ncbi:SGNH/GDSL hydrolase family protein [Nonomuraea sp. NPDC051191]|uniref:SGNH/GDSL hydrolase family protein n=1 Tax=Nonomuraea sp. NPDC051191 TaxID=3364372 RepID=UPI0037925A94
MAGRLAFAAALGGCLALSVPAASAAAAPAEAVPTVFFGDSYTANFGITPINDTDKPRGLCFQATENYPAVATRRLAGKGITLSVQSDVSCGGALVENFGREQQLPFGVGTVPAQRNALKDDTKLVVGGMGGNTLGFTSILKQCSAKLRGGEGAILPGAPVDPDSPSGECRDFLTAGDGKEWLDYKFEQVETELVDMLDSMSYLSPEAERVLVGYPRLVPQDTTKCLTPAPGQTQLPFADIPKDALPVLDQVQKRLNDVMKKATADTGADYVDLYDHTGKNTACDGAGRGIGGLLENSKVELGTQPIPWYAHPNEKGRTIQAERVAATIETVLNR